MNTRQKGTVKSNGNAGKKEKTEKTKFEEILQKLEKSHEKEIESLTVKIESLKKELEENKKKTECIIKNMIKFTESFEALKLLVLANASSACSNRNKISKNKNGVQKLASILQKIQSECLE